MRLISTENKERGIEFCVSLVFRKALNTVFPRTLILLDPLVSYNTAALFFLFSVSMTPHFPSSLHTSITILTLSLAWSSPPSTRRCWPVSHLWSLVLPTFQILPDGPIHSHCFYFYVCSDDTQIYISRPELTPSLEKSHRYLQFTCPKPNFLSPPQVWSMFYISCLKWWHHQITPTPETWKSFLPQSLSHSPQS